MSAAALLALVLLSPRALAAQGRCAAVLTGSPFGDSRLTRAVSRLFAPGGPAIRMIKDPSAKPGGYALSVGSELDVAAADAEGAYRGLVELAGRCRGGALTRGKSRGAPSFAWRGVLEGFYGKPWSWAERRMMAEWMSKRRMNLLVIAPKDDPGLRADWRRTMAKEEREELSHLASFARERFVETAWTLSPGLDLDWKSQGDLEAAVTKLEAAAAAGVRKLALAFDDVEPSRGQIRFANRVLEALSTRLPDAEWTFVPAQYWGEASPSRYLSAVAQQLDPRFRVGWTGRQILSREINAEDARRFREYVRHELVLGDNYPVQDRLWGAGRLHWGPLAGRDASLGAFHAAYVANASPLAAASKLPLATAADYAWDAHGYQPAAAWRRALAEAGGGPLTALFAAYNSASWLDTAGAGTGLVEQLEAHASGLAAPTLRRELKALSGLREGLAHELRRDPELRRQITPWAAKLEAQARAALASLDHEARPQDKSVAIRLERLAADTDAMPGVVAGQALDRFIHRGLTKLYGGAPPDLRAPRERVERFCAGERGADVLLGASLDRLAGAPSELARAAGKSAPLWRDAMPWVGLAGEAAARARDALAGKRAGWVDERLWRWRARSHFIALTASREMLEEFFSRSEGGSARRLPLTLQAWLLVERRRSSGSLPSQLAAALDAKARGDAAPLQALLVRLVDLPAAIRQGMSGRLAEEGAPWLDKVAEYGRLGLLALDGKTRGAEWDEARYRLRSSNGLELVFELKLELDALAAWARLPAAQRPPLPERRLPADPRDML